MKNKKIVFLIGSLKGGGAERVLSLIANELIKRDYNITIIVVRGNSQYILDERIKLVQVFKENEFSSSISNKIIRKITRHTRYLKLIKNEQPDILISFMIGMNQHGILYSKILNIPIIATEHNNYTAHKSFKTWITRRIMYKFADAVTILTKFDYENYYKFFLNNVYIIPNPSTFNSTLKIKKDREKTILAVGSLNRWSHKGFDNLLNVFSNISKKYPNWKLKIAGSGDEGYKYLSEIVNKLNIKESVEFLGFVSNVDQLMSESEIFVLSSRYEGFGMVLVEAMSQGCAVISYDCIAGPSEIITDKFDGLLVVDQNQDKLRESIEILINDQELRKTLSNNARKIINKYDITKIGDNWESLIKKISRNEQE